MKYLVIGLVIYYVAMLFVLNGYMGLYPSLVSVIGSCMFLGLGIGNVLGWIDIRSREEN